MNNTTTNFCNESKGHFLYQTPSSFDIFTGVLMIIIIITSLAGNILVCYAFISNSRLRVMTNYFIMNLALSDILTSSLVITFDADIILHGLSTWKYGAAMCKIWTTSYTISVPTSILTLCVVSIDRYQAISDPLGYRAGITLSTTKALCLIVGIWGLSLFLAFLPHIAGPPLNKTLSRNLPKDCPDVYYCSFDISASYSAAVTIISFILPSILMLILYIKMYIIITYQRYVSDETTAGNSMTMGNRSGSNKTERERFEGELYENRDNLRNERGNVENETGDENNDDGNYNPDVVNCKLNGEHNLNVKPHLNSNTYLKAHREPNNLILDANLDPATHPSNTIHPTSHNCSVHPLPSNKRNQNIKRRNGNESTGSNKGQHRRPHQTAYQTKVAVHFSVIVLVQFVCWYPVSVSSLVYNLCDNCYQISSSAQYFLLTIGYMTCAINPYLYAYQQRSFRQAFSRMFRIRV